jgi:addiction module HigA family antidote
VNHSPSAFLLAIRRPFLLEKYLQPMDISQNVKSRAISVPPRAINKIVLGKRAITPTMSIRFGAFFGQSDTFWHGIQVECYFLTLARWIRQNGLDQH